MVKLYSRVFSSLRLYVAKIDVYFIEIFQLILFNNTIIFHNIDLAHAIGDYVCSGGGCLQLSVVPVLLVVVVQLKQEESIQANSVCIGKRFLFRINASSVIINYLINSINIYREGKKKCHHEFSTILHFYFIGICRVESRSL